jgi:hypothetical protein
LRRSDAFYRAWDRFTQRKRRDVVPSLDVGVEGGPGHDVRENDDGVESRFVSTFLFFLVFVLRCWWWVEVLISERGRCDDFGVESDGVGIDNQGLMN